MVQQLNMNQNIQIFILILMQKQQTSIWKRPQYLQREFEQKTNFFQNQLEQRLKFIPSKEQLSVRKSSKLNQTIQQKNHFELNQAALKKTSLYNMSSISESSPLKITFDSDQNANNVKKQIQNSNIRQNKINPKFKGNINQKCQSKDVMVMIDQFFPETQKIELIHFIEACLLWYFETQKYNSQLIRELAQQCRQFLCTVDQNHVSFNAIQILSKKTEFKLFLAEKILEVKYKEKNRRLQAQFDKILEEISKEQQQMQRKFLILKQKKQNNEIIENQLQIKSKNLKNRQKQLNQREKQLKKNLQQKGQKLMSSMISQIQKISKQIDKKINIFQRNARNKLQLIDKRSKDKKNALQNKKQHQKQSIHSNLETQIKKYQNQILSMKSKTKKYQKQIQQVVSKLQKDLKLSENQSNSLLKANTLLQNKLEKVKNKFKSFSQDYSKKQQQLCRIIQDKNNKILELQAKITKQQFRKARQIVVQQQLKEKTTPNKSQNKNQNHKVHLKGKAHRKSHQKILNKPIQIQSKKSNKRQLNYSCQNCQSLLEKIQFLFKTIEKSANKYRTNKFNNFSSFEQILMPYSKQLFVELHHIVLIAIQQDDYEIQNTIQFLVNIFLARCSFLKFSQLNANQSSLLENGNNIEYIDEQLQKMIKISGFNRYQFEELNKKLGIFIAKLNQTQSSDNYINFLIFLSILGVNQILQYQTQQYVSVLSLIIKQILNDLSKIEKKQKRNQSLTLSRLQSQQFMCYLLPKFLLNHNTCNLYLETLIQLCNFYSLDNLNTPIFKGLLALNNYKYLIKVLIGFQSDNQILENVSIILQRFCYFHAQKINLTQRQMKGILEVSKRSRDNKLNNKLLCNNMENILQSLNLKNIPSQ